MFASRFLLHQNWLKGKCNVRTLEGHTQGTKFSVPVNFFELGSKLSTPFYPPNHDIPQKTDQNTGNYMPYSLRQVCGLFYVPQDYKH